MELTYYNRSEWHWTGNGQGYSFHDPQKLTLDVDDYDAAEDFIAAANTVNHSRIDVNLMPKEYDAISPAMAKRLVAFDVGDLRWISEGMTVDVARVLAHRCRYGQIPRGPHRLEIELPWKYVMNEVDEYSQEVLWHLMLLLPHNLWAHAPLYDRIDSMNHWSWKLFYLLRYGKRTMFTLPRTPSLPARPNRILLSSCERMQDSPQSIRAIHPD